MYVDLMHLAYNLAPHRAVNTFGVALNILIPVSINAISLHVAVSVDSGRVDVSCCDLSSCSGSNMYVGYAMHGVAVEVPDTEPADVVMASVRVWYIFFFWCCFLTG